MTIVLFLIRVYQQFLSPLMPLGCRFYPTCSHYAAEAVVRHGALRGLWLGLRRILRCHPFSQGGFDLVPDSPQGSNTMARGDGGNPPLPVHEFHKEPAR